MKRLGTRIVSRRARDVGLKTSSPGPDGAKILSANAPKPSRRSNRASECLVGKVLLVAALDARVIRLGKVHAAIGAPGVLNVMPERLARAQPDVAIIGRSRNAREEIGLLQPGRAATKERGLVRRAADAK